MLHAQNIVLYIGNMLQCTLPGQELSDHRPVVIQSIFLSSHLFRDVQGDKGQESLLWVWASCHISEAVKSQEGDHHYLNVKSNRQTFRENSKTHWELRINDMNQATQLDAKRLSVISTPSVFPNKTQCQGQRKAGGQMINLENHLSNPSSQGPQTWRDESGHSPLFLSTWDLQPELQLQGKCSGQSCAVITDQLELSDCSDYCRLVTFLTYFLQRQTLSQPTHNHFNSLSAVLCFAISDHFSLLLVRHLLGLLLIKRSWLSQEEPCHAQETWNPRSRHLNQ